MTSPDAATSSPPATACRRALRPFAALLLYVSMGGVLFGPGLAPGRWVYGTDTASHDLVCSAYGWWRTLEEGEIAWWGPHLRAGQPLVASFAFMPLYPPNWLSGAAVWQARREGATAFEGAGGAGTRGSPPPPPRSEGMPTAAFDYLFTHPHHGLPRAHSWQWPLHAILGAMFVAAAARARGASWGAAIAGGAVFGFGAHAVTLAHAGHLAKVQAIAWLGAVAWGLEAAARRGDRRVVRDADGGGGADGAFAEEPRGDVEAGAGRGAPAMLPLAGVAAALAMMWFAGHPQIFGYGAALVVAFAAWEAAAARAGARATGPAAAQDARGGAGGRRGAWDVLRWPGAAAGALLLALALAAPVVGPVLAFAPQSNRATQTTTDALVSSYPPEELWEFVLPRFAGTSLPDPATGERVYRGRWGERIVGDYVGLTAVLLAAAGLLLGAGGGTHGGPRGGGAPRRRAFFWAGVAGAGVVFGMGGFLGAPYRYLVETVPGFGLFRVPAAAMCLVPLGVGMLAADGIDALRRAGEGRGGARWRLGLLAGVTCVVFVLVLSPLPWAVKGWATGLEATAAEEVAGGRARTHAAVAGGGGVMLAVALWLASGRARRGGGGGAGANGSANGESNGTRGRWSRVAALLAAALALWVAADLVVASRPFIVAVPMEAKGSPLVGRHAVLLELRAEAEHRRRVDGAILGEEALEEGARRTSQQGAPLPPGPAPPPALLHDGREASLWPMLAGWRVPHGYHPITSGALERAMAVRGHDDAALLDALGVVVRIGRDGDVTWRAPDPRRAEAADGPRAAPTEGDLARLHDDDRDDRDEALEALRRAIARPPVPAPRLAIAVGALAWIGWIAAVVVGWVRRPRRARGAS